MKHSSPRDVAFEPEDQMVFVRLEDGKIDLSVYFSNDCGDPGGLEDAMTAWLDDSSVAVIAPHFKISSPVDYMIEGHEMRAYDNAIDESARPIFEAIKREMLEQVARIDALVFRKVR